jgi:uncharacterized ferredoxin-like protein
MKCRSIKKKDWEAIKGLCIKNRILYRIGFKNKEWKISVEI